MTESPSRRPAEIFGYPTGNRSDAAQDARQQYWCPFREEPCIKKSRLIKFPFGVCSVEYDGGGVRAICPHRFEERGSIAGVSRVLEDIAGHYFGSTDNTVVFSQVRLPNVGNIDYVIIKHKPMQSTVDEFVAVEIQSDSTTQTGKLVRGIRDFYDGRRIRHRTRVFREPTFQFAS